MIASTDSFFGNVKQQYRQYFTSGFFHKTSGDGLYIYQIDEGAHHYNAIIAAVDINDYIDGKMLKHENTLSTKEQTMMNLMLQRKAMIKPVLLAHKRSKELEKIFTQVKKAKPMFSFDFDETDEKHSVWLLSDKKEIEKVKKLYKKEIKSVYIADGHHRCSTSAMLYKSMAEDNLQLNFRNILCAFFSFDNLEILDYNRVVRLNNLMTTTQFMARLSKYFIIVPRKKAFKPKDKFTISMYMEEEWYALAWKENVLKSYSTEPVVLDAQILNDKVLAKILKINDHSDPRITYVEGIKDLDGIIDECHKGDGRVGFSLYPVQMDEFIASADANKIIPAKSTWFEPRLKNGLISLEF